MSQASEPTTVGGFPAADAEPIPPQIAGYRIERFLGRGGVGEVWLGRHEALDRPVAIKVLREEYARSKDYAERFLREARAAAKINHPRVVTVYDAGQVGNLLFLVMEYMPGGDAHERLSDGPLSEPEAVLFLQAAADGLQAIHDAGLLHRDLKPENLFLDSQGLPKIGDLGLARMAMGNDRMTVTGSVVGTPAYMSPEQAQAVTDIDARSDIYSLAATGFTLVTGRPPFVGSSPWATVAQVLNDPAPDPRSCQARLSATFSEAIRSALAKDPAQRPASARAFAAALSQPLALLTPPSVAPIHVPIAAPIPAPVAPPTRNSAPWWRQRTVLVVGGIIVAVSIFGITLALLDDDTAAPAQADASEGVSKPPPADDVGGIFRDMKANVRRTLRHIMEGSVADVHADVLRAVRSNGVTVTKNEQNPNLATLEGTLSDGAEMRVITKHFDSKSVEVSVQIGAFGNEARQKQVLDWIRSER